MPTTNPKDIPSVLSLMLETGEFSDLTIKCNRKEFKVHQNVVCLQSTPLKAAVIGRFLEASIGIYNMDDEEPAIVSRFLNFLYNREYSDAVHTKDQETDLIASSASSPLLINAKVYIMAEKYDVQPLKELAMQKYMELVPKEYNRSSFIVSLQLLYEGTPQSDNKLRSVAIVVAAKYLRELVYHTEFAELCRGNADLAFDVLEVSAIITSLFRH